MEELDVAAQAQAAAAPDPTHVAIAAKVRAESETLGRVTPIESLAPLFPALTPEQIVAALAEMLKQDAYQDIKVRVSADQAAFLYSETYISAEAASAKIASERLQEKIAERVRADSKSEVRLTPVAALAELATDAAALPLDACLAAMTTDERYQDIKTVSDSAGVAYLYCDMHMTGSYAALLARVEAKNPYALVAETVRDESRIYPRATKVSLFYEPVFRIAPGELETVIEGLLHRAEFADIKKVVATTGAIYLYSERFMVPAHAEAWVQWEEVDRLLNP